MNCKHDYRFISYDCQGGGLDSKGVFNNVKIVFHCKYCLDIQGITKRLYFKK